MPGLEQDGGRKSRNAPTSTIFRWWRCRRRCSLFRMAAVTSARIDSLQTEKQMNAVFEDMVNDAKLGLPLT